MFSQTVSCPSWLQKQFWIETKANQAEVYRCSKAKVTQTGNVSMFTMPIQLKKVKDVEYKNLL